MAAETLEIDPGGPPAPVALWRRRRVRRAVAVLALAAGVVWWLTPQSFDRYSASPHLTFLEPVQDAEVPVLADAGAYPGDDVQLLWVRARTGQGAEMSDASVVLCDGGPEGGVGGGQMELDETVCTSPRDPAGERLGPSGEASPPQQLVLRVTGRGTGVVTVDGLDVVYRQGLRLGYQHVGSRLVVPFDVP